ncbi:MAG TPA: hypothetical protein VMW89_10395 [Desulfatiglandales bacterium]|nr:hypothetical protein [Desulfatiglandales bacterium]
MSVLPQFLLSIGKATSPLEQGAGAMTIIVQRPYFHLEKELRSAFAGQEGVKVIVDRRYGERRLTEQPVSVERRRADRRTQKDELLHVLLSV